MLARFAFAINTIYIAQL